MGRAVLPTVAERRQNRIDDELLPVGGMSVPSACGIGQFIVPVNLAPAGAEGPEKIEGGQFTEGSLSAENGACSSYPQSSTTSRPGLACWREYRLTRVASPELNHELEQRVLHVRHTRLATA
jgi:hypothetical protein